MIVSHVTHYSWDGALHAYSPYAREIDIWADLFPSVIIAAPLRCEPPPDNATRFTRANIEVMRQPELGGDTWPAKLQQLAMLPVSLWQLGRAMTRADAIHVRCPGNLGLLGVCLAPLFSRYLVAKYAGQWPDYPGSTLANRLQKRLLRSRYWRGPVTVYGTWNPQPRHIVPFFTSVMTGDQIARARRTARRDFDDPVLRVLYVGALAPWKNVDVLIRSVGALRDHGVRATCDLVGEGPARKGLERLAASLGLAQVVRFAGAVQPDRVLDYYERAHALVLASNSEGWPKALVEGMSFGLVCIGSDRGLMPQMLDDGRGFVVPPRDEPALTAALLSVASAPDRLADMRARAACWGQSYSLEDLRDALADLLTTWWGVRITSARSLEEAVEAS